MAVRQGPKQRRIFREVSRDKQGMVLDLQREGCEAQVLSVQGKEGERWQ